MKLTYASVFLLITAVLFAFAFKALHLPAAWFFGPLVASALFALRDWQAFESPRAVYIAAQSLIGTALGAGFSPNTLLTLPEHFSILAFAVVFILLTSLFNGWLLIRHTRLDVPTAFLGTMPGGASEMAAMSDSLRADSGLVVIMQYTRLLLILTSLALVTPFLNRLFPSPKIQETVSTALLPATFAWWKMGALCLLAFLGWLTGMRTRIPAGTFLVPTLLYFLLQIGGAELGRWPWPVLATAYLLMGLQIGGRFRPSTVAASKHILLPVCGTTLVLLAGSVILAWILTRELGLEPVSAYLAATPGGLDSVAAVATELQGDTAIILTVHLVRLLSVLIVGPWLVRACSRWLGRRGSLEDPSPSDGSANSG
jgi:membrane AbrB-like protein